MANKRFYDYGPVRALRPVKLRPLGRLSGPNPAPHVVCSNAAGRISTCTFGGTFSGYRKQWAWGRRVEKKRPVGITRRPSLLLCRGHGVRQIRRAGDPNELGSRESPKGIGSEREEDVEDLLAVTRLLHVGDGAAAAVRDPRFG